MSRLLEILMTWKPIFGYIIDLHIKYNESEQRFLITIKIRYKTRCQEIEFVINESVLLQELKQLEFRVHRFLNSELEESVK